MDGSLCIADGGVGFAVKGGPLNRKTESHLRLWRPLSVIASSSLCYKESGCLEVSLAASAHHRHLS